MSQTESYLLIIEDDEDDFFLLRRAFDESGGYRLIWLRSGDEALAWLNEHPEGPTLIISDLKMPKVDGFELLEYAKTHPKLRRIPFIVLTASNEPNDRERARKHGADLYLVKPSRYGELLDIAARLVAWARKVSGNESQSRTPMQMMRSLMALIGLRTTRFMRTCAAAALMLVAGMSLAHSASASSLEARHQWPEWRGPLRTGVSETADPPITWSSDKNIKWKTRIPGDGASTPIVWGDRIFLQTAIADEPAPSADGNAEQEQASPQSRGRGIPIEQPDRMYQFALVSIDRASGKIVWQRVARRERPHEGHHADHGFASHSPVTDGQRIYAFFGSRGLYCYDWNGDLKWSKDLGRMRTKLSFGEGSSPALHGDTLVVNWDHEGEDFIAAFDKHTGRELWRQEREEGTSWATPLVVEHRGRAQVVTAATSKVRSYDLQTGRLIWEHAGLTGNVIPSPVAADDIVYVMSGFRGSALYAIRLGETGDLTESDAVIWSYQRSTPYVPSPLLYEGKLYFFASNNGILSCFDAKTGKVLMDAERISALQGVYASPVGADGRVYLVGRNGTTVVIRHGVPLEILATNSLDERIDASPALVGNDLFLRGHEHLYCISQ